MDLRHLCGGRHRQPRGAASRKLGTRFTTRPLRARPAHFAWPPVRRAFVEAVADVVAGRRSDRPSSTTISAVEVSARESVVARYGALVLDAAWTLFEIELHRHPDRSPNDVWAEVAERDLGVRGHPEWSWWAMRGQLSTARGTSRLRPRGGDGRRRPGADPRHSRRRGRPVTRAGLRSCPSGSFGMPGPDAEGPPARSARRSTHARRRSSIAPGRATAWTGRRPRPRRPGPDDVWRQRWQRDHRVDGDRHEEQGQVTDREAIQPDRLRRRRLGRGSLPPEDEGPPQEDRTEHDRRRRGTRGPSGPRPRRRARRPRAGSCRGRSGGSSRPRRGRRGASARPRPRSHRGSAGPAPRSGAASSRRRAGTA